MEKEEGAMLKIRDQSLNCNSLSLSQLTTSCHAEENAVYCSYVTTVYINNEFNEKIDHFRKWRHILLSLCSYVN